MPVFLFVELDDTLLERILEVLESSDDDDSVPSRRVIGGYELENGQRPWYGYLPPASEG